MNNLIVVANSRSGHNFVVKNLLSYKNDLEYFNFENVHLSKLDEKLKEKVDNNNKNYIVVVVRDLMDWYASLSVFRGRKINKLSVEKIYYPDEIRKQKHIRVKGERIITAGIDKTEFIKKEKEKPFSSKLNKIYFDTYKEMVEMCIKSKDNIIPIFYEEFRDSQEYRKAVCKIFNGNYNEEELETVPKNGGGSSFDKLEYNGDGSEMETSKRYIQVINGNMGDKYIEALQDRLDVVELYKELYRPSEKRLEYIN